MGKGMLLYYIYFKYCDWLHEKVIEQTYTRKKTHNVLPEYYQNRSVIPISWLIKLTGQYYYFIKFINKLMYRLASESKYNSSQ